MPYSNISAVLSPADVSGINGALTAIETALPFLINLTEEERKTIYKMGPDAKSYVDKTKNYTVSHPALIPPFASASEFVKDHDLWTALLPILARIKSLSEAIDDTMMGIGNEMMDFMTAYYSTAKEAAKRNVPGSGSVSGDLGEFFDRPDRPAAPTEPPTA